MTSDAPPPPPDAASNPRVGVIVVAGGSGQRFGSLKQFAHLPGTEVRVIDQSVDLAIRTAQRADGAVIVVVPQDYVVAEAATMTARWGDAVAVVAGGATRSASVRAGMNALSPETSIVCVHDAARPHTSADLYQRVIDAVREGADGAVPAVAVTDTVKLVDADGWIVDTPDRDRLRAVQTPQAFDAGVLRRAHADAPDGSDDAVLVEAIGGRVKVVAGERDNIKITHPDDLGHQRPSDMTSTSSEQSNE